MEPNSPCACYLRRIIHGTVTFDVRGRHVKVLPELIQTHSNTLLAQLLDDIGTDYSEPIFVDANPDRFSHILDWYRYGCMFLHSGDSIDALLHDAAFFMLPEQVIVDGIERQTLHARVANNQETIRTTSAKLGAARLQQKFEVEVIKQWPEFQAVFEEKVQQIEKQLLTWASMPGEELHAIAKDFLRNNRCRAPALEFRTLESCATIPVCWAGEGAGGICSMERLRLLASKLTSAGYNCSLQGGTWDTATLGVTIPADVITARGICIQKPIEVKILHPENGLWCPP
eukprot:TRINITY_DN34463_c0_g1_i1.p1 TRINITY_DN34463_c0_g1~~TRINITY_DN34463_c0_g1_i1.p1  ORF type:complete len:286 (-),score=42.82 TRINITY_DN34463_c0_g1_i1:72-929(-)